MLGRTLLAHRLPELVLELACRAGNAGGSCLRYGRGLLVAGRAGWAEEATLRSQTFLVCIGGCQRGWSAMRAALDGV